MVKLTISAGFVATMDEDELFDLVIHWMPGCTAFICGKVYIKDDIIKIKTLLDGESVLLLFTEKVIIWKDIDKFRFLELLNHYKGKELSGR